MFTSQKKSAMTESESFVEVGIFLIIMVSTQCLSESMVRGLQRTEDLAAQARKDQKGIS